MVIPTRGRIVAGTIIATLAMLAPAFAFHRKTPPQLNATSLFENNAGTYSCCPASNGGAGRWTVFESTADLLHNGSSGRQIFLFDLEPPRALFQITDFPQPSQHPATSAQGPVIAFDSTADILHNGNTVRQIFLWNRNTGDLTKQFSQVTYGASESANPTFSPNAEWVAFESTADLLGKGIPGRQIYLFSSDSIICEEDGCGYLHQVTKTPGDSFAPNFGRDAAGLALYFHSAAPILGTSNGFQQIFVWNRRTQFNQSTFTQLTAGSGDSIKPSADQTDRYVAFQSEADLLHNGSSHWQIFLLDRFTGELTQVTHGNGDSTEPQISTNFSYIAFVSDADLLGTGSTGKHVFIYNIPSGITYQLTKEPSGSSDHPVALNENIFFFDSTEDILHVGMTGRQIYVVNVFKILPNFVVGRHAFAFQPGDGIAGSQVLVTTRDGTAVSGVSAITDRNATDLPQSTGGFITLAGGVPNLDDEVPLGIDPKGVMLPPIPTPFGAFCVSATEKGIGRLDCRGGHDGSNLFLTQDHATDPVDPLCELGCREGTSCPAGVLGPHRIQCPVCIIGLCGGGVNAGTPCTTATADTVCGAGVPCDGVCSAGVNVGQFCTTDATCDPQHECTGSVLGVCNGPPVTHFTGTSRAGEMTLTIPVNISLSTNADQNGVFCNANNTYLITNHPGELHLTTGAADASILNGDFVLGETIKASDVGAPITCGDIHDFSVVGSELVGSLTFLDAPDMSGLLSSSTTSSTAIGATTTTSTTLATTTSTSVPGATTTTTSTTIPGPRDAIIRFHLQGSAGDPCTANCPPSCKTDADCVHADLCRGPERCISGICVGGTPIACSDGNPCNGLETCDPTTGTCKPGTPPTCDDGNPCTADSCDPQLGCVHAPLSGGACSDGNPCTTGDVCVSGECVGTPVVCPNPNVCNGVVTCNPDTGACERGEPLNCSDGNPCTDDACNPATGCVHTFNASPCDDGNLCTTGDVCTNGSCVGTPVQCGPGDLCTGPLQCDPSSGKCVAGSAGGLNCDDGDPCTVDTCDPTTGCAHTPLTGEPALALCLLQTIALEIHNAAPGKFCCQRLKNRDSEQINAAITDVKDAETAASAIAQADYRIAAAHVVKFILRVTHQTLHNKLQGSLIVGMPAKLIEQAKTVESLLVTLAGPQFHGRHRR